MRLIDKEVHKLTQREYDACYYANFGEHGLMREYLQMADENRGTARALILWQSELVAWALLYPIGGAYEAGATEYTTRRARYMAHFWVEPDYRQQGLATRLMDRVLKHDPHPYVLPYSQPSFKLFGKYSVTMTQRDRFALRRLQKGDKIGV